MQKSLSFSKGITTSPSDLLSDDTELTASRDLIFRNGEMQPLRHAKQFDSTNNRLLYIHKGADYTNAITYDGHENLYCGTLSDNAIAEDKGTFSVGMVYDISSVGNTLVVATANGLHYILFKEGSYVDLGTELPTYDFYPAFRQWTNLPLGGNTGCFLKGMTTSKVYKVQYSNGKFSGCQPWTGSLNTSDIDSFFYHHEVKAGSENEANVQNAIQGHVAELIRIVKENNRFAFPFFVRCAMQLYDGSYARISVPVACYPTVNRNCYFTPVTTSDYKETTEFTECFMYAPFYAPFQYRIVVQGIDNWKDIVKKFVVFATDDVIPFHIDKEWRIELPSKTSETTYRTLVTTPSYSSLIPGTSLLPDDGIYHFDKTKYNARDVIVPTYKSDNEIIDEMISKAQFYKLFSVGVESVNTSDYVIPTIASNVVATLTSQEQLPVDDYYGWTSIVSQKVLTYNNRINLFNVKRRPFKGADMFTCATATGGSSSSVEGQLRFYVHIATSTSMVVASSSSWPQDLKVADSWFFYPDTRAVDVVVWDATHGRGIKIPLKAHPFLNGAYAFRYLPLVNRMSSSNVSSTPSPTSSYEVLDSQIFTSVVNNPFVFQASGDNTVGTGSILGIAANTEPISQGQFGQYPLIVFTTEGIYGLSVNSEGLYSASYPISREVCNNPESITPTGNVVYFTSDKGLMAVSGGTVRCVSPQLSGAYPPPPDATDATDSFLTFVRNAFLAYDYRDSLLFIYNVSYDYAYVYNLLDGTFATVSLGNRIQRSVSNYPDTLLQDYAGNVYSFNKIPVAQSDSQTYSGTFTTRPLKLGSSIQLKTIHQIVHLFNSAGGTLKLTVWASNDCRSWNKLYSLHGKPWKYYRFRYDLTNISASDTFAGTVIDFTPRFTNKIR